MFLACWSKEGECKAQNKTCPRFQGVKQKKARGPLDSCPLGTRLIKINVSNNSENKHAGRRQVGADLINQSRPVQASEVNTVQPN